MPHAHHSIIRRRHYCSIPSHLLRLLSFAPCASSSFGVTSFHSSLYLPALNSPRRSAAPWIPPSNAHQQQRRRRRLLNPPHGPLTNHYSRLDESFTNSMDNNDNERRRSLDELISEYGTRYNRMMDSSLGLLEPVRVASSSTSTIAATTAAQVEEDNLLSALQQPSSTATTTTTTAASTEEEEEFDDTAWSIYSNTFFLSGGIFYLLATSWDYALFHADRSLSIDDALTGGLPLRVLYEWLWFMGPLTYLLNSIIDVRWAWKVRERDGRRRELEKLLLSAQSGDGEKTKKRNDKDSTVELYERGEVEIVPYDNDGLASPLYNVFESSSLSIPTNDDVSNNATPHRGRQRRRRRKLHLRKMLVSPTKKIFHRMRKHMGHRRDLMAAITFGMAAALSVAGAICYLVSTQGEFSFVLHSSRDGYVVLIDENVLAGWAGGLEKGSIHMYLVSAVFALWRNPWKKTGCGGGSGGATGTATVTRRYSGGGRNGPTTSSSWFQTCIITPISRPFNDVDSMETVGDVFFGIASVVDVILEDSTLDDNVLWWPIVSAVLWTLDALFYLRGDFVTLFLRKEVWSTDEDGEDVPMGGGFVGLDGGEEDGDVVVEDDGSMVQVWEYPVEGNGTESMVLS